MRGTATFIGGPLDEQVMELPDLLPVYRVPVKDRVYNLVQDDMTAVHYGIIEYRRTRVRKNWLTGRVHAVYEVDL